MRGTLNILPAVRTLALSILLVSAGLAQTAGAVEAAPAAPAGGADGGAVVLSAKDLYAGFEARRVLLDKDGAKLVLDARALKIAKDAVGVITTDVLDLGPASDGIGLEAEVRSAAVEVAAELPEGASATVETRSGASFFDQSGWSPWLKLEGLKGKAAGLKGRYLQVRVTLKTAAADKLPAVSTLTVRPEPAPTGNPPGSWQPVKLAESKVQNIVRSAIDFKYERPDQEKLAKFRKDNDLDGVVAGKYDEEIASPALRDIDKSMKGGEDFIRLVRLMDWVGHCTNDRTQHPEKAVGYYDWNIDAVFKLVEVEKDGKKVKQPTIYGHCMSYSEVLTTAATAMGYVSARHLCMVGFREASHEVCDIWVPSLGRWVYFDPSLTNYYYDKETKAPMNLIEMHRLVADKFVPEDKDMHWWIVRGSGETQARVKSVGGKAHIGSRLGRWCYGAPMAADYDWGWRHGYLAAGFVQMTPRNDFHSDPKANPKAFEHGPGYAGYPNWVDDKTPPKRGGANYYTRPRDFYWTLDQAGLKLTRTGEDTISVELGNSMPFFKKYVVKIDGAEVPGEVKSPLVWKLKAGDNKLEIAPVDEFGKTGLGSAVAVKLGK